MYSSSAPKAQWLPRSASAIADRSSTSAIAARHSAAVGSRTRWCLLNSVSPTGTTEQPRIAGPNSYSSRSVCRSTSPSFTPGDMTIWVWNSIPCSAKRRSCGTISGAVGLRSRYRRTVGSVACTET